MPPTFELDSKGILHVGGTTSNDEFSIRKVDAGHLRVNAATSVSVPTDSAVSFVSPATAPSSTSPSAVAVSKSQGGDLTLLVGKTFKVKDVKGIIVVGDDGQDLLRTKKLDYNVSAYGVERTIIVQQRAPAGQTPSDPAAGIYERSTESWRTKLLDDLADAAASDSPVAFFGDSHAERYQFTGKKDWNAAFGGSLNLGVSGDGTRQLLARIRAGLFDDYKPDRLVLMAGTNNFNDPSTGGSDAEIFAGMRSVIAELRARLPDTKLLIVGVLPRHLAGVNERSRTLNANLATLADGERTFFVNVFDRFVGNPVNNDLIAADDHLTVKGYHILTYYLLKAFKQM